MNETRHTSRRAGTLAKGVLVLACICLGSGAGVGLLYWQMKGEIEAKARGVFFDRLAVVLGEAEHYDTVGAAAGTSEQEMVYRNGTASGVLYAAMGTAMGYSSVIKVLVSVEAAAPDAPVGEDPVIHAVAVVESQETPGLGENINAVEKAVSIWGRLAGKEGAGGGRPWFQEQFSGMRLSDLGGGSPTASDAPEAESHARPAAESHPSPYSQAGGKEVVAITGATITSEAAVRAVRDAVTRIIEATAEAYGQ